MRLAQDLTSMVFSLRKKENLRVRQPLQKMMVPVLDDKIKSQIEACCANYWPTTDCNRRN